jgi:predicted MFS family arabinose efflux permease
MSRGRGRLARRPAKAAALRFVLMLGILSFFADFTYEGARSAIGPFLAALNASGAAVGIVTGFGEFLGYALRLGSGRLADATRLYWPITILGYVVQMAAVPALALADGWPMAAVLIVLERVGRAIRTPPRDAMLAYAGERLGGYGWVFGLREAMDQLGAMFGPLAVGAVLAHRGDYRLAFVGLLLPALICLAWVLATRLAYPRPQDLEPAPQPVSAAGLPRVYWVYLAGAALIAAGFADYPLIAYHFGRSGSVPGADIARFYAVAMAMSGAGSLVLGRLFDRFGFSLLIALTLVSALFAPLVFLGGYWLALLGAAIWGLGTGVHEAIIPAAVAPMATAVRRASAYGVFAAVYGSFWFLGSAAIGILYDASVAAAVAFCVAAEIAAIPFLVAVAQHQRAG